MFVRSKVVKGHTYYQVIEGYRDPWGKVRHRTVASLGRHHTIAAAIETAEGVLGEARAVRARYDGRPRDTVCQGIVMWADQEVAKAEARVNLLRSLLGCVVLSRVDTTTARRVDTTVRVARADGPRVDTTATRYQPPSGPTPAQRGAVAAVLKMLAGKRETIDTASVLGALKGVPGFNEGTVGVILDTLKASGDYARIVG